MKRSRMWAPEMITHIELANSNLTVFHVGDMKNLVSLNLSNNKLTDIRGNGLEHLLNLKTLNLKDNLISKKENLKALW
jgi:Leucine-rich repeat (LRR) protein